MIPVALKIIKVVLVVLFFMVGVIIGGVLFGALVDYLTASGMAS